MGDNEQRKPGYRCAVCTFCGRCFREESTHGKDPAESRGWSGERCDVCVGCGKCAEAWGLVGGGDIDAMSGPTSWADSFKRLDVGGQPDPPAIKASPGQVVDFAAVGMDELDVDVDGATGATPGVAAACKDLGISKLDDALQKFDIKPPGVA